MKINRSMVYKVIPFLILPKGSYVGDMKINRSIVYKVIPFL
jgi:hypothetical protein